MIPSRVVSVVIALAMTAALGVVPASAATRSLKVSNATVTEGDTGTKAMRFVVRLSSPARRAVKVLYRTVYGAAKAADVVATKGELRFARGQFKKTVRVAIKGDLLDEFTEAFTLKLSNARRARIADGTGSGKITDNDAEPTISIADALGAEGNTAGSTSLPFTVTLSAPSGKPVSVVAQTTPGTATAPADYTHVSQTVQIPASQVAGQAAIPLTSDTAVEDPETFNVILASAINAGISDGSAVGTITNDDSCTPDSPPSTTNTFLGSVSGDTGEEQLNTTGDLTCQGDRKWYRVTVSEDNDGDVYLSARMTLTPGGVPHYGSGDVDLYLWREDATTLIQSSTLTGTNEETVNVRRNDDVFGESDAFTVYVEVRSFSGANSYALNVLGNVEVAAENYPD